MDFPYRILVPALGFLLSVSVACGSGDPGASETPPMPCNQADPSCLARIAVGAAGMTVPYYSTMPLATGAQGYRRAIVVMHGTHRDADGYFNTMVEQTQAAGALPYTVVVAPWFQTAPDRACSGSRS